MAATLPTESEASQQEAGRRGARKQWSVHAGGPRGLLRRMRSQLAEDGCPDSQLVMGRTLLEQLGQDGDGGGGDEEEDGRLAVFWLTRASLQGSAEATHLLEQCLNNNIGICEHNYHEVQECLSMDLQEKLARRAARLLFASINDGNEAVTSNALVKKVKQVLRKDDEGCQESKEEKSDSSSGSTLEELYGGERFLEDHIISAAVLYHQGHIPPLHHLLDLPLTFTCTPTPQGTLARAVRWPLDLLSALYIAWLRFIAISLAKHSRKCVATCGPVALVLTFVLCYVSGPYVLACGRALPVVIFCGSFAVMVTSTALVLLDRQRLGCLRVWSAVFSHFCPELDVAGAERRFESRCWRPYVLLCASVLVYVSATPLVPHTLTVAFMPVMCLCSGLMFFLGVECVAVWHFISLALYLMALRPEVYGWVGAALQGVGLGGWWVEGAAMQVWGAVNLHLGIGTLLHLLWLSLQVCVGVVRGPKHLPSHLASLMWAHLAFVGSVEVTEPQDLIYPVVSWLALILVPACVSVGVVVLPVLLCVALAKLGVGQDTLMLAFILGACVTALAQRMWPRVVGGVLRVVVVCAGVVVLLRPSAVLAPVSTPSQHSPLLWDAYKNVCLPSNNAQAENVHVCAPLLGTAVRWRGSIIQTDVTQVRNLPQTMILYLPSFLEVPVKCYLGQRAPECPTKVKEDRTELDERCEVIRTALGPSGCSLHEWNEYEFVIALKMQSSYWKFGRGEGEVSLRADDTFTHFVLGLREGDMVEFTATMSAGIGTSRLTLTLSAIKCITCKLAPVDAATASTTNTALHSDSLRKAGKYAFNFFLAPTLTV
ncbi:wolframin-like isoform X2 [Eriocheir sinensis]|uniref:wolframin-like isoform X2 n=1 Tax=Eriocheir sinensis TaxID=95602 RepID=UPI0021C5C79A|nr:wolframin-like isoform X2 [Eriocheir sinensis]